MTLDSLNKTNLPDMESEAVYDLDAQELLDELISNRLTALENEAGQIDVLLRAARESEQAGPDAKAECLIDWIYQLQSRRE